jgi:hypothetical protein
VALPVAFVVLLGVIGLALAGNEIVTPRFRWRETQP